MDKTKIAVDLFDKYAREYQNKFMDTAMYHESFDIFCKSVKTQNAEILELACGPGNITSYLLKKRPDFKITGTDLSPNMIELAKTNNPSAEFHIMDCRAIDKINKLTDAIICGFCLPYLSKEETFNLIANAARILKTDGVIYISTMEDDYSKSGFRKGSKGDDIFMHFYEADYLVNALNKNGFTIIDLQRKEYIHNETKTVDLLIIAIKQMDTPAKK